ncbi:MAG: hypothetical protein M3Z96_10825, partial [Pseudomonadota bacterium]|nr:hypothetical protein [Pseudomonadota bacterium]
PIRSLPVDRDILRESDSTSARLAPWRAPRSAKYVQSIVFAHFPRMRTAPTNANTQGAVPPMIRKLSRKSPYAVILILLCLIALMEARHPFPSG